MIPQPFETEIIDDLDTVSRLLDEWGLSVAGILAVRDIAYSHLADTSPLMASNASGTLAYHYGIMEMRAQFLGKKWEIDRSGGIESIITPKRDRKVVYQNVDVACSKVVDPSPRSEKGSGFERTCQNDLFEHYGVKTAQKINPEIGGMKTHCIMVDERGAVEFSRPVSKDGKFYPFIQRLFVSHGIDPEGIKVIGDLPPPIDDFDINISRR
jgi:hypothetical protein